MARQPNKKKTIVIVGVISVVILGVIFALRFSNDKFAKCTPFPVDGYLNEETLWSSADYVITGTFQNILLKKSGEKSTLCSIMADEKKVQLPVVIIPDESKAPLQREQKIKLKVRIEEDGSIIASDWIIQ